MFINVKYMIYLYYHDIKFANGGLWKRRFLCCVQYPPRIQAWEIKLGRKSFKYVRFRFSDIRLTERAQSEPSRGDYYEGRTESHEQQFFVK